MVFMEENWLNFIGTLFPEIQGETMRASGSLVAILVVLGTGYWFYATSVKSGSANGSPAEVVSSVGAKSDLLSMAQAERIYQASHGSYASLDELYSSGSLMQHKPNRNGYTYSSETSAGGFTITARCLPQQGAASCPSFSIDETMQVQQIP